VDDERRRWIEPLLEVLAELRETGSIQHRGLVDDIEALRKRLELELRTETGTN
jgi:hypothetical protein